MPQTPERKKQYAKERRAKQGDAIRAKQAEWAATNRERLLRKNADRRRSKRAMCLVAAARVRARKRSLTFDVPPHEIERLQAVIDAGRCELSGVPLTLDGGRTATSPSLDRIKPERGYVVGNLRIVCHALNAGMGDWGAEELRRIALAWLGGNAIVPQLAAAFIEAAA